MTDLVYIPYSASTAIVGGTLIVDKTSTAATPTGSWEKPFPTISAAISSIPVPTTLSDAVKDWTILIAAGDYDESLSISGPMRLSLIGLGPFRLGNYTTNGVGNGANLLEATGGTPRNIVWTLNTGQLVTGGPIPQFYIGTIGGMEVIQPTAAGGSGVMCNRVSGGFVMQGTAAVSAQVNFANVQFDAGVTTTVASPTQPSVDSTGSFGGFTAYSGQLVVWDFQATYKGTMLGPQTASGNPALVLGTSFQSNYQSLATISGYGRLVGTVFLNGITVSRAPNLAGGNRPSGMYDCAITGTFTATASGAPTPYPANALLVDDATNNWIIRNGVTFAGSAGKSFVGSTTPTRSVSAATTLTVTDTGMTIVGNPTAGSFAVNLPALTSGTDDATYIIKNLGTANLVNVTPNGTNTIDGVNAVYALTIPSAATFAAPSCIRLIAKGTNWNIVGKA